MAWNEPGGNGSKDPWGSRKGSEQGPPDLDEMLRKLQQQFRSLFGGNGPRRTDRSNGKPGPGAIIIAAVLLVLWALSGIYIIDSAERGVLLRFGNYAGTTGPGLHWRPPYPIETVDKVNVDEIRNVEIGFRSGGELKQGVEPVAREALMLTEDENIVDVKLAVQYRVKDARDYLFNVIDPDATLVQATESAVREIVGKSSMDFVLTEGRTEISNRTEELTQQILDRYKTGLQVTSVNMQDAQPPDEVQDAFQDAIRAISDEQRLINEAQAYANDIIPRAKGAAARLEQEGQAYKAKVITQSQGEASRFTQVLGEYLRAPEVTRKRLYLESMESVLSNTSKVMVDVKGGNNLLYLPLDRLVQPRSMPGSSDETAVPVSPNTMEKTPPASTQERNDMRNRNRDRGAS